MLASDLSFDQLYRMYVGKNVFNFFRQDHGYNNGSYVTVWDGREDNEHLSDILSELEASDENFTDAGYRGLKASIQASQHRQRYKLYETLPP